MATINEIEVLEHQLVDQLYRIRLVKAAKLAASPGVLRKAGARHSGADLAHLAEMHKGIHQDHDRVVALGVKCNGLAAPAKEAARSRKIFGTRAPELARAQRDRDSEAMRIAQYRKTAGLPELRGNLGPRP